MRILIVEDDEQIAHYLQQGLEEVGYTSDHLPSAEEGIHAGHITDYDLVIIDIMLPGMNGFDFIKKIRETDKDIPILVLSAKQSVSDKVEGLQRGADDYITKPFSFHELIARIQALLRRYGNEPTDYIYRAADIELNLLTREVKRDNEPIYLQPKEFALLEFFMRNIGKVMTKTVIMEHIWNFDFDPQTNVVDVLVCRLRKKIQDEKNMQLIRTIKGVGYVFKEASHKK